MKKWDEDERALDRQREAMDWFAKYYKDQADAYSKLPKLPWGRHLGYPRHDGLRIVEDDSWRKGLER